MRILFLIFCLLNLANVAEAQDKSYVGQFFLLNTNLDVKKSNGTGRIIEDSYFTHHLERNWKILVEAIVEEPCGYIVSVVKFGEDHNDYLERTPQYLNNTFYVSKDTQGNVLENIYFYIPCTIFDSSVKYKELNNVQLSFGIPVIGVKMRFGNGEDEDDPRYFNLERDINLGFLVGAKFVLSKKRDLAAHILIGPSTSYVAVDSVSTNGFVSESANKFAFSPTVGLMFQFNNLLQLGVFSGFDILPGEIGRKWAYRNSPWLGFGLGFNLFSSEFNNKADKKNKTDKVPIQ
jgi:hypothetical protein